MIRFKNIFTIFFIILFIFTFNTALHAQELQEDHLSFHITPYFWLAGASGNATIGPVATSFDYKAIDILKMLNVGGMARFDVWLNKFRFNLDVIGMHLDQSKDLPLSIKANTDIGMVIFEWGAGYHFGDLKLKRELSYPAIFFEPSIGGRFTFADLDLSLSPGQSRGTTLDYVEPYLAGKMGFLITDKWSILIMGNIGGFGIEGASDLTWNLSGTVHYRPWQLVTFGLGYRAYDIDYKNGNRILNMNFHGPVIAATFHL